LITKAVRVTLVGAFLAVTLSLGTATAVAQEATNPHWNKSACQTCHVDAAPTAGNLVFQGGDAEALCGSCHGDRGEARPCRHVSGLAPVVVTIPESYAASLRDGEIVCTTCHDLSFQCLNPNPGYRGRNFGFVRARQSRVRGDACFLCHEKTPVEQLNPHEMEVGNPPQATCTFCHATMPVKDENGWVSVDFHVEGSLNDICFGCHRARPHPGFSFGGPVGWDHLVIPSRELLENMKEAEQVQGMIFPIDPNTAEVYCATCHNPHHESLEGYPVAKTPGAEHRLRVTDNCQACHDL
jgi:predicted CXXCH cytochrome family protein